jgi:YidC/Oxa1 family membrane protein insertase
MDDQSRNLILATALSFLVILGWFVLGPILFPDAFPPPVEETAAPPAPGAGEGQVGAVAPPVPGGTAAAPNLGAPALETRDAAHAPAQRVPIQTDRLVGSLSLTGGRIDDLKLSNYHVSLEPNSPIVTLFSPAGAPEAYYSLFGWAPAGALAQAEVPGANTPWELESGNTLTETTPVTLRWENDAGLIFRQTYSVDENYMFTLTQSVENQSGEVVRLQPYGTIARHGKPSDLKNFYILHEGAIRMADGSLEELGYNAVADLPVVPAEGGPAEVAQIESDGWVGITGHYWMSTLTPLAGQPFTSVVKYSPETDIYQTDARLPVVTVAAGGSSEVTTGLFAGAKVWSILRDYQDERPVDRFVDAIDWGWFFFLTKPIFRVLHEMNQLIGNMGVAIIGLTLLIKLLLFPLAYKSYVSMSKMKQLQPQMEKIKETAGDDRMKMQQEVMALYKREKVNPAAGCLPILLQIPIFFSLYKVIFVTIELRHAPFFGWIRDLSAPDPTSILNLFGLLPWAAPSPTSFLALISIGIWPILLGISMWLQQKLNPMPTDKTQAMIFAWMPWVFMFMLGHFASGLVIYWVANNTITFAQQYTIMRTQGVQPNVLGNILAPLKRFRKAD